MRIAFGPMALGFGSWEWAGEELIAELGVERACSFVEEVPQCDVAVFIKFKPSAAELALLRNRTKLVYCPVDIYDSAMQIDADWESLRQFDCIISHAASLLHYFRPYARTEYLDHHLRFTAPLPTERKSSGPILWTGNIANLPPLVEWVNQSPLPEELWVLTNLEHESVNAAQLGFSFANRVRVEDWSPAKHCEWAAIARAAIDIKGSDFRARHKPPTKAFDAIVSGLPLAMNRESSPVQHLASKRFSVADPRDRDRWFSEEYWSATQKLGRVLLHECSRPAIADRLLAIIDSIESR